MTAENGHWMPIYWADYFADTTHLTTEEHGAYFLLIGAYWRRGKALPAEDNFLASAAKVSRQRWAHLKKSLGPFFEQDGVSWTHKRVESELLKSCSRISSAQAKASARWHPQVMQSTITSTKEERKKTIEGFLGKKNGKQNEPLSEEQKLALFQKTLAESFPDLQLGWRLVGEAANPSAPNHLIALQTCKLQARGLGKGWPHQWPK